MARYQLITGPERRRFWSEEQKRAIVAAAFAPGAIVAEVARRAAVCPGQIYRWRQEMGGGGSGFAAVVIAQTEESGAESVALPAAPAIEVAFTGVAHVRIPASMPPDLAAAVVKALRP
jgi:transposase